jgi:hypothetical protein
MACVANPVSKPCLEIINGIDNEPWGFQYHLNLVDTPEDDGIA